MTYLQKNVVEWDSMEIASWLCSINLSYLIPTFEKNEVTGATLYSINESFMKETLRINKPAEIAALKGALAALIQQDQLASQRGAKAVPKNQTKGSLPRVVRDRTGSNGADAKPTSPKTATMPARKITIDTGAKDPQLLIAPARQLLDDHCKHSGWIRKQGGGHRNCKLVTCGLIVLTLSLLCYSYLIGCGYA